MLPKPNRLTKKKDFDAVFGAGKSAKATFLIGKVLANNLKESRFGFVVSKKISLKATVRNKIRRRLREAIALQLPEITTPVDMVLITLPLVAKKGFDEISQEVRLVSKKLGLLP